MNCEELRDHYELFALGVADEPEQSEIRAHLGRGCEVCMKGIKEARELSALLGGAAPAAAPSRNLRRRILASAGAPGAAFGWVLGLAAAVLLCLSAAVYFGGRQRQVVGEVERLRTDLRGRTMELARLNEAFAILTGPGTTEVSFGQGARGKVYLSPGRGVLLIASNLPPAPPGKVYEMWIIPRSGNPVAAGLFQSESGGTAMHLDRGPVDPAATQAVAVTLENEGGANQPTSQPLIVAALQ